MLATHMRDEMLREGRHDEIDELVRQARDLQDRLQETGPRQAADDSRRTQSAD